MARIWPLFNYFGGKYYLAPFIVEHFPRCYYDLNYIEPCVGAGSVFLLKRPTKYETISDINPRIINVWRCVRDRYETFHDKLRNIEYSRASWQFYSVLRTDDPLTQAIATYIKYRMSRSGRGDEYGYSERQRGGQDESLNKWVNGIANLAAISERCQNVQMEARSVVWQLERAEENTFLYIDPTYLADSRTSPQVYECEMSDNDHVSFVAACLKTKAKVMVSMYLHPFYVQAFSKWRCITKDIPNHSGEGKIKQPRREAIWMNYD